MSQGLQSTDIDQYDVLHPKDIWHRYMATANICCLVKSLHGSYSIHIRTVHRYRATVCRRPVTKAHDSAESMSEKHAQGLGDMISSRPAGTLHSLRVFDDVLRDLIMLGHHVNDISQETCVDERIGSLANDQHE